MKKIINTLVTLLFLANITACAGYKPIFSSSNLDFEITEYSISGNKIIVNQIYSQLNNLSKTNSDNSTAKSIYVMINS